MRPGSPEPQIDPDRRPEALPEPIPADQTALFRPMRCIMMRQDSTVQTPGRPHPRQVAHQQSQIEFAHVDQQSLAHVGVAPDEDAGQPARDELVREGPLHQLASLPLHPSSPPPPIRFRQIPPQSQFLWIHPILVARLLIAFAVESNQFLPRRRRDSRAFCQSLHEVLIVVPRVPPHQAAHRHVRLQRRRVEPDRLPPHQSPLPPVGRTSR